MSTVKVRDFPPDQEADNPPALEVAGLSFSYSYSGTPILVDVELTIARGELVVLLGPNGAGKTTLFSLITRLYDRRAGTIRIDGYDVRSQPSPALARLGVVFQQPTLDLDLSARQNLAYHAALHGLPRRLARTRIEEQLGRLEMTARMHDKVRRLSGGQRRRVEIARALVHHPRLLLLDEPTVGLDIATRKSIVEHVHKLCAEEGVAVLWATHLIDEVHDTDTVIVLDRGCIRARGSVADINSLAQAATLGAAFEALTQGAQA